MVKMAGNVLQTDFLSSEALAQINDISEGIAGVDAAVAAPEYVGGLLVTKRMLEPMILSGMRHYLQGVMAPAARAVDATSKETYTSSLATHAAEALRQDIFHGLYLKLAELVTGASVATDDEVRAQKGLELGRRIVVQRAHRTAFYLADSAKLPQTYIPIYDDETGDHLLTRASHSYGKNGISPLATTQKSDGRRFQRLIDHINEAEHPPVEDRLALEMAEPSHFGWIGRGLKWSRPVRKILKQTRDIKTVDHALEEAFDTYFPKWDIGIKDEDVLFIARFSLKVKRLIAGAARRSSPIAEDPRFRHLATLNDGLTSWNIPAQTSHFEAGIRVAAQQEPR